MTRTALVLRHEAKIHLGNLEPVLVEHGYSIRYIDTVSDGVSATDADDADLVVVLGGEMGVYDDDEFPVIRDEVALIKRRIASEQPVFGVCLGAQLMASALGAAVYRGETTEIGYRSVEPTPEGADSPVRHVSGVPMMQWHGDTFDLPQGVTRLAGSPQYGNEAFGIGNWALAVQFHPEITSQMHEEWLQDAPDELAAVGLDAATMRDDRARYSEPMQTASARMFSEWLDGLDPRRTA